MQKLTIKWNKLYSDTFCPQRKTAGSAGYDIFSHCREGDIEIEPGLIRLIPTGFAVEIPGDYHLEIRPRSGLSTRYAIIMPNAPGTIDADYRGEVFIPLMNLSKEMFYVSNRMRIAQMLVRQNYEIEWQMVEELAASERGKEGFGSTGI